MRSISFFFSMLKKKLSTSTTNKKKKKASSSKLAVAFAAALVALLVLDGLWINVASKRLFGLDYFATVEGIQGGRGLAKRPIGLLAYLSMAAACSRAAMGASGGEGGGGGRGGSNASAAAAAAAAAAETGFYIYSIYDFTNTFLFEGWAVPLALADVAWGTGVFAAAGAIAASAATMFRFFLFTVSKKNSCKNFFRRALFFFIFLYITYFSLIYFYSLDTSLPPQPVKRDDFASSSPSFSLPSLKTSCPRRNVATTLPRSPRSDST